MSICYVKFSSAIDFIREHLWIFKDEPDASKTIIPNLTPNLALTGS